MKSRSLQTLAYSIAFLPLLVFAAPKNLKELIKVFTDLINPVIGLLTGFAVLLFVWGIVEYILYSGDEKKKKSAKDTLFWGVIALFVLFSFWSIVQLLKRSIFG
ncbi:MAG TPA: pilin [Candidatus Paceibacterota bacterium]|nr:pilin [Candidatus Paceibacterota bacterium]